jgi:hypothetical protein
MDLGQAGRVAQLARLAPKLIEVCVTRRPDALHREPIVSRRLPAHWAAQQELIAVASSL